ncbi:MAG: hypothetical protein CMB84_03260 [Flammeovirgaceae bacterium]|nr:hypothetical protein [Flammeovirgaceae bacterium]
MNIKKKLLIILISFLPGVIQSQHIVYSQYYSSPLILNPSMTGLGEFGRFGINYRNQWTSIGDGFNSYSTWFDYNFLESNFSVGVNFSGEEFNLSNYSSNHISPSISYEININSNMIIRSGFQINYSSIGLDNSKLIFFDQLGPTGLIGLTSENLNNFNRKSFLNLNYGILIFSEKFWLGSSIYNLLQPDISLSDQENNLKRNYSLHGGMNLINNKVSPSFNIIKYPSFIQFSLGSYFNLNPISIGLWYRAIPLSRNKNNLETIVGKLNFKSKNFSVAYSYDYNLPDEKLGSHEISLMFDFHFFGKKLPPKNVRYLKCPVPNF